MNVGISQVASIESWVRPLALGVVSIAAIITPLGLYDAVVPTENPVDQVFKYAHDPSPMGFGTPPRSDLGFNRLCGYFSAITCPSSVVVANSTWEKGESSSNYPYGYNTSIPHNLTEIFQSGLENMDETVSSLFDIEYRSYENRKDPLFNNGSQYLVGAFRQIETLALNDDIRPVEGLVVDTKTGGIGFRNHTIPEFLAYGAEWSEDLLFVEPETHCVDTNTTLDFTISVREKLSDLMLTDRGGFANLNHDYPEVDENDTQANPDLLARAYMAAWTNNAMTMFFLNISNPAGGSYPEPFMYMNSTVGKQFPLPEPLRRKLYYDALLTSVDWGSFLNTPGSNSSLARSVIPPNQKRQEDPDESSEQKDSSKPTKTSNQKDGANPAGTSTDVPDTNPSSDLGGLFDSDGTTNPGPVKYANPFQVSEKNFTFARMSLTFS